MKFEDVNEVVEAWGAEKANELLAGGWKLLAVVQGTVPDANSHIKYVLGKAAEMDYSRLGEYVIG